MSAKYEHACSQASVHVAQDESGGKKPSDSSSSDSSDDDAAEDMLPLPLAKGNLPLAVCQAGICSR